MPDELEQRLERTLGAIPPPGDDTTERALRAALGALPPAGETRRRRRRRLLLPAAACAVAFVFGGVTLAATGGHLPLVGHSQHPRPAHPAAPVHHPAAALPRGAIAFSATADGRAWLATSAGASLRGRPLSALGVSPGAVNLIEGEGRTLRAVHVPDGDTAFAHDAGGSVAAAVWAPAGIRIAYVVRTAAASRLYDMYGNGTHRYLVAAHTDGQAPTWRWDSLAFAYIRADGTVMVHSAINGATSALPRRCGVRRPAAVAFAPFGGLLAIADRAGRVRVVNTLHNGAGTCVSGTARGRPKIAWLRPRQLLVGAGETITRYVVRGSTVGVDVTDVPGRVAGLVAGPGGRRIALALRDPSGGVRVVEARTPRFSEASTPLAVGRVLVDLGRVAGPVALAWQ